MAKLLIFIEKIIIRLTACFGPVAERLNLTIEGNNMSTLVIGQTATATIAPTPVGAIVTNTVYTVTPVGAYTISVGDPTGLTAVYTAAVANTGCTATVTANASDGSQLTDTAALPDVVAAIVATALNLTITTP
jgi:hypothetical protein